MIASEVMLMRRVKHPNIVSLICEFDFPSELYLVLGLVKVRLKNDQPETVVSYVCIH